MRLDGKVALVTGAGSGIGRATALVLAREGARVAVCDINLKGAEATVAQIAAKGGVAAACRLDVADEAQWTATVEAVRQAHGGLHALVNNAGVELVKPILDTTLADWRKLMAVNLDGVFLGIRAAAPAMLDSGGGAIVNISSIAGMRGYNRQAAYCTSKGGVRILTKAAAVEFAERGWPIRVNSVHPGVIDTPMLDDMMAGRSAAQRAAGRDKLKAMMPINRLGEPADIAEAVLYLVSDAAKFVTGVELPVDGGLLAR